MYVLPPFSYVLPPFSLCICLPVTKLLLFRSKYVRPGEVTDMWLGTTMWPLVHCSKGEKKEAQPSKAAQVAIQCFVLALAAENMSIRKMHTDNMLLEYESCVSNAKSCATILHGVNHVQSPCFAVDYMSRIDAEVMLA